MRERAAELDYFWLTRDKEIHPVPFERENPNREACTLEWGHMEARGGKWLIILNCPCKEKHSVVDPHQALSGPTFAECAACPHQRGTGFVDLNADGGYDGTAIFPENLDCGYIAPRDFAPFF